MRGSVLGLSPLLVKEAEYGRRGDGPGEYSGARYFSFLPRYWDFSFVGAAGQTVAIYDGRDLEVYDVSGEFVNHMRVQGTHLFTFGVRYVQPLDRSHSIVVMDSVDLTGERPRRLQTWLVEKEGFKQDEVLLWEVPLLWQKGPAGTQVLAREARPFWARRGTCHLASDGASPFLWRYNADDGRLDSLSLPRWDVPEFGDDPDDGFSAALRGLGLDKSSGRDEPTEVIRWTDLAVDPDGWVWVKAWTKERGKEIVVFAVSIETGEVIQIKPPFFPRAFGDPGVAYAIEVNPDTDEQLIVRYEAMAGGPQ